MIGQKISHYRVLEKLGDGGMGVVYKAKDTKLGRLVALKFLAEDIARDETAVERFKREARTASALDHPNICTIYEISEHDGQPFIAMQYLEGETLKQRIGAQRALSGEEVARLGLQAAEALETAHAKGVVHRDIKPANIFLSARGHAVVLDFGLAKLVEPAGGITAADSLTQTGVAPGTLPYMAPEQLRGQEVDARTDLYALGCVLYEMATGQRPFRAELGSQLIDDILHKAPATPVRLNPEIPAELERLILKCLDKDPENRYQSAKELRVDLRRFVTASAPVPSLDVVPARDRRESRPSSLPMPRTAFVGREREVAALEELLLRQDVHLVTVTGPGGIGKTRLGLQVASKIADHFSGGVHFVSLAAASDPGLLTSVIAQTLGVRETRGQPPLEALKDYLRNSFRTPLLLLLDNFEHLVAAAPMVAELLTTGRSLKVLVTSRAPLHVYGEHEFPVPQLSVPDLRALPSLELLAQYSAVALFLQRAGAVKPDFGLTKDNAPVVAEICACLDGLPLAIELAAARVKLLSPSAMRTHLASRLQLLTGGARDLPARQQTLRGAIDWSYDLLTPAEQKLFRRLSVFVGGCTLEAVEAVCNTKSDLGVDLLDGTASMVDKSLLQQVEPAKGEPRFVMLGTIREYAREKLAASGEEALTRRAHAAYCLVLAEEIAPESTGAERAEWLDCFEIEHDNFRAALEWAIESGSAEWGLRLGTAIFRFWEMREYLAEGRDRLGKLLKLGGAEARTRARALFAAGVLAGEQGDYASADALIEESLAIARKLEDKPGSAICLNALAVHARDRGDAVASASLFEESLVLWRELGNQLAVARSLSNLANVLTMQGDYARARSLYEDCLAIFRELGDPIGAAWSVNHLGDVARDQGDAGAARSLYEQSLAAFRELGDRWGIASSLADLGNLARDERNYDAAHSLYRESMSMFQGLQHKRGIARLLEGFACLAAAHAEPERALRFAGAAAALRQTLGAPLTAGEQVKLETSLAPARQALTTTAAAAAWQQGWETPLEKGVEEGLAWPAREPGLTPPLSGQ